MLVKQSFSPVPSLSSTALLAVEGLEQNFGGIMALAGVSFQVPAGLIYAVIGPNGAGKTTLFNALCGFTSPPLVPFGSMATSYSACRLIGSPLKALPELFKICNCSSI